MAHASVDKHCCGPLTPRLSLEKQTASKECNIWETRVHSKASCDSSNLKISVQHKWAYRCMISEGRRRRFRHGLHLKPKEGKMQTQKHQTSGTHGGFLCDLSWFSIIENMLEHRIHLTFEWSETRSNLEELYSCSFSGNSLRNCSWVDTSALPDSAADLSGKRNKEEILLNKLSTTFTSVTPLLHRNWWKYQLREKFPAQ